MTKKECGTCGREGDGHWIGCAETAHSAQSVAYNTTPPAAEDADQCAFPGCLGDKRPQGKGPKPKYCTEHSDPKNRK
jgi:hypothetical protein